MSGPEKRPLTAAERTLAYLTPRLIHAERERQRLLEEVAEESRALARERGCGFIRMEKLRAEFGEGA
jgi:hypothetical protein